MNIQAILLTSQWKKALRRFSYWLVPLLLGAIGLAQLAESTFGTLTRWKGGGFGMFSTYDSPDTRFLKAYILTDTGELPIAIPSDFSDEVLLIQTWPRQSQLQELAKKLAGKTWISSPFYRHGLDSESGKAMFPNLNKSENRPKIIISTSQSQDYPDSFERIHVNRIRVEVWKLNVNSKENCLYSTKWMSAVAAAHEEDGKS